MVPRHAAAAAGALLLLGIMVALVVALKKRTDAEADGSAYAAATSSKLSDRLFGNGGGLGGGAAVADDEAETGEAEEAEEVEEAEAEEAEAEADEEAEPESEEEAEAEEAAYRAEWEAMVAEVEAGGGEAETSEASTASPEATGLARLVAPAEAEDTGEPQGFWQRRLTVDESIVIDAPVAEVWAYVGRSENARQWSVYFHHITPLPGVPDGQVGALRRCFRKADETGRRWDERLVSVVPQRLRKIHVFGLSGFWPKRTNRDEHFVWQVYEPLGPSRTKLTFRTCPATKGFLAGASALASKRRSARTFEQNLENIKAAVEQGPKGYRRPHAYWD